jgi:hypothetical protein
MGFKAEWVAEPLDYDFAPYAPNIKGTIPEPSTKLIDAFRRKWDALFMGAQLAAENVKKDKTDQPKFTADAPMSTILQEWADFELESPVVAAFDKAIVDTIAFVCQNKPSAAQINKLPARQRQAFVTWVREEMTNPKLQSGAEPLRVATPGE